MKVKTSVTLSPEVLAGIDELAGEMSRSEYIEQVVSSHLRDLEIRERNMRDAEAIARYDGELEEETEDVLATGIDPFEVGDEAGLILGSDADAAG
ncbi:MAG: hypothetical protein C0506_00485 [Anaerolinea sp.]|nr:hypothetical protein [Anaerolinea sp.]